MRYPLGPLLSAAGLTEHALFLRMGTDTRVRLRASQDGLTERQADRWACALGLHPELVWGNWLEDHKVPCADPVCEALFLPSRKGHRYCSRRCSNRHSQRLRYQRSPEHAERQREQARRYYEQFAEYKKAQARRRWWADVEASRERQRQRRAA